MGIIALPWGVYFWPYPGFGGGGGDTVRYSGIQLDTARYVRIQLDTVRDSGIQWTCCKVARCR